MPFVMALPWRWLAPKPVQAKIFSFFPMGFVAYPGEQERLVEDFMSVANSVAFNTLADDIVGNVFLAHNL